MPVHVVFILMLAGGCSGGCSGGCREAEERARADEMRHQDDESERYEAEVLRVKKELVKRFDRNNDGELTGKEEQAYQAHLLQVRSGQVPNPFEVIVSPGAAPR
jgi:hypothetical protein